ncbi:MAG: amidase family protein [Burkholderiaceae bacterium]|nr:amidase family protein [Burkholderiaceae bacterium]
MSEALWSWSAHRLAAAIRGGAVSAREAVAASLDRAQAVNPALNAVVDLLADEALAAAQSADAARRRGDALGPLHGVPVTVKVNVDMAGRATTNGVVAFKDNLAAEDSPVVANLRRAGAVIIGRTNTPAFSVRWFTENDLHGRTLNPWSRDHTPGGSSGGASSAVAAGIGAIAHGNDLAGSVRYPAYCTGVCGLRPSFGRVPAFLPSAKDERPMSMAMMSVQGPLAREVADLRLALAAMSAGDPRDPWWVPAPLTGPALPRPLRVAMTVNCQGSPADPAVVAAVRQAGAWLADAGYAVEEVEPPSLAEAHELWKLIGNDEARKFMWPAIEQFGDEGVRRSFGWMLADSPVLDHREHLLAFAKRSTLVRRWQLFLERYPLVLGPVSGEPPFPWGWDVDSEAAMARVLRAQESQFAVPVLGLPALSVPTGLAGALPMGVQLIGPRFREDLLLDAAEAIESRCPPLTPIDPR